MADVLVPVHTPADIFPEYRGTPIETWLAAHATGIMPAAPAAPALLIVTCMDYRVALNLPADFAFVLRAAGAHSERLAFNVSFAVSVAGVTAIAVMSHTDCAMLDPGRHHEAFVEGLAARGWEPEAAAAHFAANAGAFAIDEPAAFALAEAERLAAAYPGVRVAPIVYRVADGALLQVQR